ncbi:MAG: hypothetical protein ACR2NO_11815, partial [Chloroflexota bacterium]
PLTVLLNLGKLTELHQILWVQPEDDGQLRRAHARLELARATVELNLMGEQRTGLERALRLARLRTTLDELALLTAAQAELRAESERQAAALGRLRGQLANAKRVHEELATWLRVADIAARHEAVRNDQQETQSQLITLGDVERTLPQHKRALEAAQAVRSSAQALVDVQARAVALLREKGRIAARFEERREVSARCGRLDQELDQLRKEHQSVKVRRAQLATLATELEASRVRQRGLAQLQREVTAALAQRATVEALAQRAVRVSELLTRWIAVRGQEESAARAKRLMEDLSLGVAGVELLALPERRGQEDGNGLLLRLLIEHPLTGGLALQVHMWPGGAELDEVRAVNAEEAQQLSSSGVPTLSAGGLDDAQRDRRAVVAELERLGERAPRDLASAEQRRAHPAAHVAREAAERDAISQAERCLQTALALQIEAQDAPLDALTQLIADALRHDGERQAELSISAGRREGLQRELALLERNGKDRKRELAECRASLERDSDETLAAQRAELDGQMAKTEHEISRLGDELREALGAEGEMDPREAAQRRVDELSTEVAVIERRLAERAALEGRASSFGRAVFEITLQLAAAETAAGGPATEARSRIQALQPQLEALGEAALRAEEQAAQRAAGAAEARLHRSQEDAKALSAIGARLTAELGFPVDAERLAQDANVALPEVANTIESRGEIEAQLGAIAERRGALERGAADARITLGAEEPLRLEEAESRLATLDEEHAARRRGQEIVSLTRQRMINKVLPDTINNMCVLLPTLTSDRYRYAQLTPDYKLQVWDERAKAYVEKSLFSGGTQDQFSLALRLGFALAALPRELGTSPGFLFLDEPLSSFDRDRTEALVTLLTQGQIATFFRQVLLISHSQSFDPALFTHHIVMEHGRVVESTLPAAT